MTKAEQALSYLTMKAFLQSSEFLTHDQGWANIVSPKDEDLPAK